MSIAMQHVVKSAAALWDHSTLAAKRHTNNSHSPNASLTSSLSDGSSLAPPPCLVLHARSSNMSSSSASEIGDSGPPTPSLFRSSDPRIYESGLQESANLLQRLTQIELEEAKPSIVPEVITEERDVADQLHLPGERDVADSEIITVAHFVPPAPLRTLPPTLPPNRPIPQPPTEPAGEDLEDSPDLKPPELELPIDAPAGITQRSVSPASGGATPDGPEVVEHSMERGITLFPDDEKVVVARPWYTRFGRNKFANYTQRPQIVVVDADSPAVVLPYPPTTDEKHLYATTRRTPLYIFGSVSFLSVSVGMWFFSVSAQQFYWFAALGIIVQLYLVISYGVGYTGKDYDLENHKNVVAEYATTPGDDPSVDILLPCCKEPLEILENTYKYVAKLSYTNFKVWVLDDGGLQSVQELAAQYGFNYIRRENRGHLKKAGNLRHAFTQTSGDFFTIFDADFCPRHDFLQEILPLMRKEPDIAIVQTPQFFRPCEIQTWVEQGASATQELFYRVIQVNRDRWGAAICVGSNAVYRREALKEVGGTAEIGHSEDVHTGFFALTRGWRLKYIPLPLACGISPDTAKAYFSQQMRWCSGSTTLLSNPDFWTSNLTIVQKVCFLTGMLFYTASAVLLLANPLPGLLMLWLKPQHVLYFNFVFVVPALIDSLIVFRLWSRQRYNFNVNFVYVIQQYAYLMAIKDKVFGTTALWVPSGDSKAHDGVGKVKGGNNKYRNSRVLCAVWVYFTTASAVVGSTLRILQGFHWYNFVPLIVLDAFTVFITFRFIWLA
ncbi:family 2 glycosyl transferase [Mycena crocata]|nr:family 2 glycosyl transferase [Mycena crocata]